MAAAAVTTVETPTGNDAAIRLSRRQNGGQGSFNADRPVGHKTKASISHRRYAASCVGLVI